MKRFLTLSAIAIALAVLAAPDLARGGALPNVRLDPRSARIDWSGGEVEVTVRLDGLDHHGRVGYDDNRDTQPDRFELSEGLAGYEFLVTYDPSVVDVVDVEAGEFIRRAGRKAQCFESAPRRGQQALGCASTGSRPGPQGSGELATLTLRPIANGTSFLALEATLVGPLGDPIPIAIDGGVVEVVGAPTPTARPTSTARPGATATPTPPSPGATGDPSVIGGGTLGDVGLPEGDPGHPEDGDDDGVNASGVPSAGTGYQPSESSSRPLVIGGGLAVAGAALLVVGARLAGRGRA